MAAPGAGDRRVRLGVWAGFELPALGLAAAEPVERRLDAVYYDTADLRLLRRGVTVRREGGGWSVRRGSEVLASAPGGETPPAELAAVAVGWALGEPLAAVARLVTVRRSIALRSGKGDVVTLADDDVTLLRGERVAARFRELDLALENGAPPRLLARLEQRLRAAGAQAVDPVSKVVRGLAPAALQPPLPEPAAPGPDASAAEAIRARLLAALERWVDHHAPLLLDGTPETVAGVRGGARALRRDLRAFGLEAPADLKWLADALAPVRELDRLLELAREEELRASLAADRAGALAAARAALREPRYAALLRDVARLADRPPLPAKVAGRPAAEALPALVLDPLRRVRRAKPDDPERLRRLVERLAAAARAAAPYARADLRQLAELRAVLREHHRALTAIEALRALAARSPEHAWAAGLLAGEERTRAAEARAAIPEALERATRRKLWAWVP